MRYLLASDLHYTLPQLDWIAEQAPEFDAVILAGDHLDAGGRVDLNTQITLMAAYLEQLATTTTVLANSGNHDLTGRRADGEKAATWMAELDDRVITDGGDVRIGADLVSVCAWWEGPSSKSELERQLHAAAELDRDGAWIWVYHSPPDASPTSWSGRRHYGDDVLDAFIERLRPDLVLTGHVHEAPFQDGGSWFDRIGATLVLNAGRQPGPMPAHVIIDTAERFADWWTSQGQGSVGF